MYFRQTKKNDLLDWFCQTIFFLFVEYYGFKINNICTIDEQMQRALK